LPPELRKYLPGHIYFQKIRILTTPYMIDIQTHDIQFSTKGQTDIIDITDHIQKVLAKTGKQEGQVFLFAVGSTTGLSTIEYEPGLVNHDIAESLEIWAPYKKHYQHTQTWGDDNGGAHVRSTIVGPSLHVPFVDGQLTLGTWQQIVFLDFDTRPRQRKVVVQVIGK
jgi:secondary thiamine-phosphate synthase enzyme